MYDLFWVAPYFVRNYSYICVVLIAALMYTAPSPEVTTRSEAAAAAIREQIGQKAFTMLGAKLFAFGTSTAGEPTFCFRIQGSRKVNHIQVVLTGDTYRIDFGKVSGLNYGVVATSTDVLISKLHEVIEQHTGLLTSLTRRFN